MLRQRFFTALILLGVLAGVMWVPTPWPFMVLLALITGSAAWEWARLTLSPTHTPLFSKGIGILFALVALALAWSLTIPIGTPAATSMSASPPILAGALATIYVRDILVGVAIPLSALLWLSAASIAVLRARVNTSATSIAWTLFAVLALLAAYVALVLLFVRYGAIFVLSLLALVWVADTAAYFGGRTLGRHALMARISPGKTLEGALIGVGASVLWIGVSQAWPGTFAQALVQRWGIYSALLMAVLLAVLSILGDLFESLLKRRAGRKDSSALLPGHGGVYDRIDAILPVLPVAFILMGA